MSHVLKKKYHGGSHECNLITLDKYESSKDFITKLTDLGIGSMDIAMLAIMKMDEKASRYMTQKSIKKNSIYSMLKTGSAILFPLITFPYISRVLLTDSVGKINFGLSIVSYFSLIASLGINTYAIRECSAARENKEKLSNIASQIFSINIVTTVMAYIALAITLLCYPRLENYRVLIVVQSLTIGATTLGADWLNSAMEDFKYITLRTVTFQFLSLVLMFILVYFQF